MSDPMIRHFTPPLAPASIELKLDKNKSELKMRTDAIKSLINSHMKKNNGNGSLILSKLTPYDLLIDRHTKWPYVVMNMTDDTNHTIRITITTMQTQSTEIKTEIIYPDRTRHCQKPEYLTGSVWRLINNIGCAIVASGKENIESILLLKGYALNFAMVANDAGAVRDIIKEGILLMHQKEKITKEQFINLITFKDNCGISCLCGAMANLKPDAVKAFLTGLIDATASSTGSEFENVKYLYPLLEAKSPDGKPGLFIALKYNCKDTIDAYLTGVISLLRKYNYSDIDINIMLDKILLSTETTSETEKKELLEAKQSMKEILGKYLNIEYSGSSLLRSGKFAEQLNLVK